MSPADSKDADVHRGTHGSYHWLTAAGDAFIGTFLRHCPDAVLNHYIAVASYDSGIRLITDEEISAGWTLRGDIAYSPRIDSIHSLKYQRDGSDSPGFDEWYVFETPHALGPLFHGNPFTFELGRGEVLSIVNQLSLQFHAPDPGFHSLLEIFWTQLAAIDPQLYIADGHHGLTLISKDPSLLDRFEQSLLR